MAAWGSGDILMYRKLCSSGRRFPGAPTSRSCRERTRLPTLTYTQNGSHRLPVLDGEEDRKKSVPSPLMERAARGKCPGLRPIKHEKEVDED